MIERLKEYVKKDKIYQDYKNNKLMNANDFEKFCIQHCKDIEELMNENKQLKINWNKLKEYIISTRYEYGDLDQDLEDYDLTIEDVLNKMQELVGGDNIE